MNLLEYSEAFDRFVVRIESFNEPLSWEFQSVFDEVCVLLRISKIDLRFYESSRSEELNKYELLSYYQKGTPKERPDYVGRHVSKRGTILLLNYYHEIDDAPWDEIEISKIKVLDATIYNFNARTRLTRFVENEIFYDSELHVPNMSFFNKEMGRLTSMNQFDDYGICFFNIKRFSIINQMLGRDLGTKIMSMYIVQLQRMLKNNGTVCRVGGDNFVVLFKKTELDTIKTYLSGANVIYDSVSGASTTIRTSAGIFVGSANGRTQDEPVEMAHMALLDAKRNIGNSVVVFDDRLRDQYSHVNLIESLFKEALEREEFLVYYQPKVQLTDYTIMGAEALCRWRHEGRIVRPDEFIPVLEQSSSICLLDFYMLEHVCKDLRRWLDCNYNVVRVSVNFSRRHLGDDKLVDRILEIVDKYSVPHQLIEIELTETTTDVEFNDLKKIVNDLHENDIHTAVDDFGIGYSSLNLIRQVAWDVVKIDKSFLPDVNDKNSVQYLMFRHLLSMFRELGQKCVVEGVETIDHVKMLKENNCFVAQGFYFDKPLENEVFEERIK